APMPVHSAAAIQTPKTAPSVEPPEADVSGEWESMLSVEQEEDAHPARIQEMPVAAPPSSPAEERIAPAPDELAIVEEEEQPAPVSAEQVAEKIEAIRHYIHQEVWDAAKRAILDLTEIAPDAPEVTEFIAAVSAGQVRAAAAKAAPPAAAFADEIVAPPPAPPPARPAPPVRAREP